MTIFLFCAGLSSGGVLTFKEQETERSVSVRVLNDAIPEIDESFSIQITSPTGGSILGTQTSLACTILTNDNAHGLLGFQQVSMQHCAEGNSCQVCFVFLCQPPFNQCFFANLYHNFPVVS